MTRKVTSLSTTRIGSFQSAIVGSGLFFKSMLKIEHRKCGHVYQNKCSTKYKMLGIYIYIYSLAYDLFLKHI